MLVNGKKIRIRKIVQHDITGWKWLDAEHFPEHFDGYVGGIRYIMTRIPTTLIICHVCHVNSARAAQTRPANLSYIILR